MAWWVQLLKHIAYNQFNQLKLNLGPLVTCLSPCPFYLHYLLFTSFYSGVPLVSLIYTQLQDREVLVSLLVGAKYGMSQVINHKLNVISTLVEFSSISRVELLSESDKVSLLRVSLHDMKVWKTRGAYTWSSRY